MSTTVAKEGKGNGRNEGKGKGDQFLDVSSLLLGSIKKG